jgi:uncharacterized membrane protein
MAKQRYDSVDVLRALALIGMVICHYPIFLSSGQGHDAMLYFLSNHLLGGDFAASWFVFLVGLCQALSSKKRNLTSSGDIGRTMTRGGLIFVIGLLFLFVVQGYGELWVWDILTFIGATTIILLPVRRAPTTVILLCCVGILFLTPWLRSFVDLAPYYGGGFEPVGWISDFFPRFLFDPMEDYHGAQTVFHNVLGFFLIGQFPIFPWIIFPLLGFVIGKRITGNVLAADTPFLAIIGLLFTFMGIFIAYAGSIRPDVSVANDYVVPLSFYPASYSMCLLLIGIVLLLYMFLYTVYDARQENKADTGLFLAYCRQISKYSLTIYITHFALFFIPLRIVEAITGVSYLKNLVDTTTAFLLSVLLLILYYPLLRLWDKAGGRYSFEWLLAKAMAPYGKKSTVGATSGA